MKQRPRIYYTESQKAVMWERWRKGESLQQIAQLFDRNHSSIQRILAAPQMIPMENSRTQTKAVQSHPVKKIINTEIYSKLGGRNVRSKVKLANPSSSS